jgi:glutamate synthase (NADPH/NADH) small chain
MPNLSLTRTPMQQRSAQERKNDFRECAGGYTAEEAREEASRCLSCREPSCRKGCPIENRIPEFLAAAAAGSFADAYAILRERTCMPAVCGRVCPHEDQCEGHCVRGKKGEPVAIGAVERFVADWALQQGIADAPAPSNGMKMAVVGAGPAGLACAGALARRGYAVTVWEAEHETGGVLTWGIPSFRLPDETVAALTDEVRALGVEFRTGEPIGAERSVDSLLQDGTKAVFLGTGALISNKMNIPGEELTGVWPADRFLREINLSPMDESGRRSAPAGCGRHVLVVGGGNVAMDAARCAVRLPGIESVTIVYRRTETEMPACREELLHAREEGVVFRTLTNPVRFVEQDGHVCAAECAEMELGEPDASGRRRPIEKAGEHILIETDTVVLALGFSNDPAIGHATPNLKADRWGAFVTDENGRTSRPDVFAGGDAVTGAATVVAAMRAGLRAAEAMDADAKKL